MRISIIAAVAENGAIGKDNQLLWHIRDDLKLFKRTTLGHPIIMGRKSFESIGKALPGRTNVVITRKSHYQPENVLVFNSLNQAFDHFLEIGEDEVFVIGGGEIYRQSLNDANRLHLSHVHATVEDADTWFPTVDFSQWEQIEEESFEQSDVNQHAFTYRVYERKD
ncbi:MAG: dihydrofolate reductase [Bacteroidetes bacterium]|nr:dihydrofolate reductase [Bacteroidota bacterium]